MKLKFPWKKIQLINACKEFADMRLWETYENMDFFVVETPLEEPVVVSIMGAGGEEYGISVFRGADAFKQPIMVTNEGRYASEKIDTIGFSMCYYRDMQYEEKKWYKSCNYRAQKSDWLPSIILKKPGQMMQMITKDHDIDLMLYIVRGILGAHRNGNFCPSIEKTSSSKIFTVQVFGDIEKPDIKVAHKSFSGSKELLQFFRFAILDGDVSSLPDLSSLPKLKQTWVIVPVYVTGKDGGDDDCIFAIAEEKSYCILHAELIEMDIAQALNVLFSVFSGDNTSESIGIPEKIIIAEKNLFKALKYIEQLGINVCCQSNHPVAKDIRENISNDLLGFVEKHFARQLSMPDIDLSVVPDDDDLENWKLVQKALTNQFINFWHESDFLRKAKPSKKFFGDSDWDYYIDEYDSVAALPSYVTWAALDYRKSKKALTFAQKLLAGDIPESLRISLESLNNSYPSLYQVKQADPDTGYIVLNDLILSKTITVHDQGLSETTKQGWIVPLWVYAIGNYNFINIAGPVFSFFNISDVLDELEDLKLPSKPTAKWLRDNAHLFGRLWPLYDEIVLGDDQLPQLTNTDGHLLEFISAYFKCNDTHLCRKELLKTDDIDYDQDRDEYIWFKDNPDDSLMGTTLLGRIVFQEDKIVAETNSKKRLDVLIGILESIDGVCYIDHDKEGIETLLRQVPSDNHVDELELPQEVRAAVQGQMKSFYMDWLDKPNPALGNMTPRQAAQSKDTALKTRILIESIPAPASSNDIKIPKKEMLKSIGLETK